MRVDKIASVALTLLVVASVLPTGMVGTAGAQEASNRYVITQGDECWEVTPFEPGDQNPEYPEETIRPHVEIVDETEEFGYVPNRSWDGSPTIESVMDYRYRDPEGNVSDNGQAWGQIPHYAPWLSEPYWKEPWAYGTYGLWNWSTNQESHMFFYDGPEGDSLVVRHDKLYDDTGIGSHGPYNGEHFHSTREGFMSPQPGGGAVSFVFRDLPAGEWAYMDDLYPEDMDALYYDSGEFDYDEDRHTRYGHRDNNYGAVPIESYDGNSDFTAHWRWGDHGTDGGAYRGLQNLGYGESITIEPYFNEESYHWSNYWWRYDEQNDTVTDWVVRRKGDDNVRLDMDEPVTITRGGECTNADLSADYDDPEVGGPVTFDAGTDAAEFYWDLDGDGEYERNRTDRTITHRYDANRTGERTVEVLAESAEGTESTDSIPITVRPAEPPTAAMSVASGDVGLPDYHVEGERLVFDASNSTDNGRIDQRSVTWTFGDDNSTVTGETRTAHRFDQNGSYEVSLTVADRGGREATVERTIEIEAPDTADPEASLDASPTAFEADTTVEFDASASDDNRGIAEYRWDLDGDGEYENATSDPVTSAVPPYRANGTYEAAVAVEDGNGNTDNATVALDVTPAEDPTIGNVTADGDAPAAATITAGDVVDLYANATDNVGITEYAWDLNGDGEYERTTAGATLSREFDAGTYDGSVRASDAAGHAATRGFSFTVDPGPDAELAVNASEVNATDPLRFDANGSTAPSNVTEYRWDFDGDGDPERTTGAGEDAVIHRYDASGTYTATVTIGTERGNANEAAVEVTVNEGERAIDDEDDGGSTGGSIGGGGGGGGGGGSASPPAVVTQIERAGANATLVDVRNGRADETVSADLRETGVANATGVRFDRLDVNLDSDDAHVAFEAVASAKAPGEAPAPTASDRTLASLDVSAKYLEGGVENATVSFGVERAALGELRGAADVSVYGYDGSWERLDATMVEEADDGYRFEATTDRLGAIAVGADRTVEVADAALAETAVGPEGAVEATATLRNPGASDRTVPVSLALDGGTVATERVSVPAGERTEVTLRADDVEPGTYEATLGGDELGDLTVEEGATGPADVSVVDLSLSSSSIEAGETVAVTATVENAGGEPGTVDLTLSMFGEDLETETVEVPGGERREVTFEQRVDAGGTYTVGVNDETARLEVTGEDDSDADGQTPSVPGFGVGTAAVALLAAALLARRGK
ncbi:PKD domain-containing protein [Halorussus marinus]|uniref:PKD domain-containing protein n=1 Tax=Halorussus marinus TaxID=2505976 RepID=UPI00106DFEA2|nr:PKD domain-containing protein [Halorussus marinus]